MTATINSLAWCEQKVREGKSPAWVMEQLTWIANETKEAKPVNMAERLEDLRNCYRAMNKLAHGKATTPVAPVKPAATNDDPTEKFTHVVPDGIYTVTMKGGQRRIIRLREHWEEAEARKGTQVAYFLCGPDNESSYKGFAFVGGRRAFIWKRFRGDNMIATALNFLLQGDNYLDAGQAYALESGKCWRCGHTLTVPASIYRGVGPICAERLGLK